MATERDIKYAAGSPSSAWTDEKTNAVAAHEGLWFGCARPCFAARLTQVIAQAFGVGTVVSDSEREPEREQKLEREQPAGKFSGAARFLAAKRHRQARPGQEEKAECART